MGFVDMAKVPGENMPFWKTAVCALSAGGIAPVFGNPADLSLIRMQADSMLPAAQRQNYQHVFHAMSSVVKEEGAMGLAKGSVPTATRAMALNFGMLGFNTQAKQWLKDAGVTPGSATQVLCDCGLDSRRTMRASRRTRWSRSLLRTTSRSSGGPLACERLGVTRHLSPPGCGDTFLRGRFQRGAF